MIEWRQLLEQTHPNFQTKEKTQEEIHWISSTEKLQNQLENIPDRMGFKIGEVASYVGVKQYVLRYWESEFDKLRPVKSKNGQRMYTKKDMKTALIIRKLLHEDRFSIEGARAALKKLHQQVQDREKLSAKTMANGDRPWSQTTKTPLTKQAPGAADKKPMESAHCLLESIRQARESLNL